jgi:hypothetical protein
LRLFHGTGIKIFIPSPEGQVNGHTDGDIASNCIEIGGGAGGDGVINVKAYREANFGIFGGGRRNYINGFEDQLWIKGDWEEPENQYNIFARFG